nr:pentapeptide repeat-containing protein [Microlunatus panaciterrae]
MHSCDLANAEFTESGWQRLLVERSRLTGLQLAGCTVQNVRFVDDVIDLSNWRFAKLARVVFERCSLTGSDWNTARLENVLFDSCDLTDAQFSSATTSRTRFQQCTLDGLRGVASLSGSVIDPVNVVDLSLQLAAALGITIATD